MKYKHTEKQRKARTAQKIRFLAKHIRECLELAKAEAGELSDWDGNLRYPLSIDSEIQSALQQVDQLDEEIDEKYPVTDQLKTYDTPYGKVTIPENE